MKRKDDQETELAQQDEEEIVYKRALLLLKFRKRSRSEMERRLLEKGFPEDLVARTVERLEQQGLIDDEILVQCWRQDRESFRPKGKRLLAVELKRAGVAPQIVEDGLKDVDDRQSAYQAAEKKARLWAGLDYDEFRKKLSAYLSRRGYDWGVIHEVVQRLWQDSKTTSATSSQRESPP